MISRTNTVLAVLLGGVVLLAATSGVDYSKPNVEVLGGMSMKYTPASTAFEPNAVFRNGMTQQEPIPGTIPRGKLPLHIAPLPAGIDPKTAPPEDAVPGKELGNPFSLSLFVQRATKEAAEEKASQAEAAAKAAKEEAAQKKVAKESTKSANEGAAAKNTAAEKQGEQSAAEDSGDPQQSTAPTTPAKTKTIESPDVVGQRYFQTSVDRGGELFRSFCVCCHGPKGQGDGLVAQRGYPPPPSFQIGNSKIWNDGQLFYILTNGRLNMPPFGVQLSRENRWDLINYVRSLQTTDSATTGDQPGPTDAANEEANKETSDSLSFWHQR